MEKMYLEKKLEILQKVTGLAIFPCRLGSSSARRLSRNEMSFFSQASNSVLGEQV